MSNSTETPQSMYPTTELVGSYLSEHLVQDANSRSEWLQDPAGQVTSQFNVNLGNTKMTLVANSDKEVNLILPYYSQVEDFHAKAIDVKEMDSVSGGEIIFSILGILGGIGAAVGVGSAVVAGAGVTASAIGFTVPAVVAGAAIAGTAATVATGAVAGVTAGAVKGAQNASKK